MMAKRPMTSMADPLMGQGPRVTFKHPWLQRWMRMAHTMGNIWAWILLTLFYVIVLTPFGLAYRTFADPLRIRRRSFGA